ncbi:sulfotransferase family protein [Nocardioides mangrovi]|uniref:Sulfotransferase domain-containing protein n=1 Tax=Nocardioides mangrovi TaxID=2874580 RepID=A0ABS7UG50_9ACTN|nr:sulfotransferase [Nocardioides mangrovi]MBZ5739742.1 sulfotransferase domain-containing protein [Nocardioides mangrovi]
MSDLDQHVGRHQRPATDTGMPGFAVIGAQKSASTFLQDQMSLHPDIEIPEGEVRCFEDPFFSAGDADRLPELYHSPVGAAVRGIKRPDYLGRPEIPGRLHDALPDLRILVVLRDPVARAVSSYYHFVRHGFVPLLPIDQAVDALLAGTWDADYPRAPEVLTFGRYGEHLDRYLGLFPADRIAVFEQVQLIKHPQETLRSAFEFVGVDPDWPLPEQSVRVSNRGVYSPARLRLLRTKNRTRFTYSDSMDRRYPRRMTPWGWMYNASVVGADRLVLSRLDPGRPPELSEETRHALDDYYASDLDVLRGLLPTWGLEPSWL